MNQDQKYFHTLLNQAIVFDDAPGECQEGVWSECLVIIHEAGDRAARLGLPQIVEKTRRFKRLATPGEAKAIIAECLAALTPTNTGPMTVPEVAKLLRVRPDKVLAWIRSGRLRGYNVAEKENGRPKYRINPADLEAFIQRRAVTQPAPKGRPAGRRRIPVPKWQPS